MDPELKDAIADAAKELKEKAGITESEETPLEEEEQVETPESEEVPETNDDELNDDSRAEAINLYKALRDPKTAGPIIAALAQQAGILNPAEPATTKAEKKLELKAAKEILKEKLGPEYSFMSDKLGDALEQILDQTRQEQEKAIDAIQQTHTLTEINNSLDKISRETKGESKKLEPRMVQLMEKVKPSAGVGMEEYLRMIYTIASNEKRNGKPNSQQINNKIRQNAADGPGRLRANSTVHETVLPEKKLTAKQAVEWAVQKLEKGK